MICILMKQNYYQPYLQHLHTFLFWMFFKFTHFMRAFVKKQVNICNLWKIVFTFAPNSELNGGYFARQLLI